MSGTATRVPVIHADLPPSQRRAFGRWVRAVYGLVEHLDTCCFGCTAEQTRCAEGDAAVDAEAEQWQAWRDSRDSEAVCSGHCDPPLYAAACPYHGAAALHAALAEGGEP